MKRELRYFLILCLFTHISCSRIASSGCNLFARTSSKTSQNTIKNFNKIKDVKYIDEILIPNSKAYNPKPYLPDVPAGTFNKPTNIGIKKNYNPSIGDLINPKNVQSTYQNHLQKEIYGSNLAKSVVQSTGFELKVFNSSGDNVAILANQQDEITRIHLQNKYRQELINIVDEVFDNISVKQINDRKILEQEIIRAVNNKIKSNPALNLDMNTGMLTCKFSIGLTTNNIRGSINILNTVKNGLVIGMGGYYKIKQMN